MKLIFKMRKTKTYMIFCLFCFLPTILPAQVFKGKVTDANHTPLAYVNVILQELADSAFIAGCITDTNGFFYLETDTDNKKPKQLKTSSIGYSTKIINIGNHYDGTIVLNDQSQILREVTIKGHKPIYRMKAGVLTSQIKGSVLSDIGTASDVLRQLPFITTQKNTIKVFGKGTPLIYINNRLVRNDHELEQLKSEQIKDVQLIMNPESQYDAETNAVIKITTLRPTGDGIGGSLSLRGEQKSEFTHSGQLDLTYRKNKWDAFMMLYYDKEKWNQEQTDRTSFYHNSISYKVDNNGEIMFQYKLLETSVGFNYTISPRQSVGLKYTYSKDFTTPASLTCLNHLHENSINSSFHSNNLIRQGGDSHYVSAYYCNEFENKNLFHLDGTFINKENFINAVAWNDKDNVITTLPSQSNSRSQLYALKMWGEIRVGDGNLEVGAEGTSTKNTQNYRMENEAFVEDLPTNQNESEQNAIAAYILYAKEWGSLTLNGGVRYEYIDFDYSVNGMKQDTESKTYQILSPSLSLSYQKEKLAVSLNYRTTVRKPGYWQLRSNISYNNNFSYEGGNPALQRMTNHHCGLMLNYGGFLLECDYNYKKDDIMLYQQHFKEKPVILTSFMNHDRETFSTNFSYSPVIGIWKPSFMTGISMQNMHYNGHSYNKPIFSYMWKNIITFPTQWTITFNLNGSSYGHSQFTAEHSSFNSDFSIRKRFKKSLDLYVGVSDLFNTYREQWSMNMDEIWFYKWNNLDYRHIYLRMVLRLNKAKNKYKGGSAGQSERNRL